MDFNLTPEQIAKRDEFSRVCRELEKLKPRGFVGLTGVYETDAGWEYHLYCAKEFAKRGWLALGWPEKYGGSGSAMDRVLLAEARGYSDVPGIDIAVTMLAPTLMHIASEEIKQEFLPAIFAGESMWCELWSEPDAGSDLAGAKTTAIREGDEYVVNGQKIWVTGAQYAPWGFALVKTSLDAPKHKNLSFLLMDMQTPGITVEPIPFMHLGQRFNRVYLDNVRVPAKNIVGEENGGWAVMNLLAGFERSNMDEIMRMVRAFDDLVAYCRHTERNGSRLGQDPMVRDRLAQIATDIEAARTLACVVADQQTRNGMLLMDASAVKVFYSELQERFAMAAQDILGPYGGVKLSSWAPLEGLWERIYQESFVFTVSAGTNEIQRNIIAWYGLGLPRMK